MKIDCNHHVASFSREDIGEEERYLVDDTPLGLVGTYSFMYRYPLSVEVGIPHPLIRLTSAIDILLLAKKDYEDIYAAEDAAVGETPNIPGMLNRDSSEGPYGIWGHCLSDLYFEQIEIDTEKKIIKFCIGS
jgi:hypothetical protein